MNEQDAHSKVLVTVCTYNEAKNVATLVPAIRQHLPQADILVVDDNSPDGTADVVRRFSDQDPHVSLLLRTSKSGLGAATIEGFRRGLAAGYEFIINLDADWSHPPDVLPKLLRAMDHADVAIGSRYVPGGAVRGWPWSRHMMSAGINWYSRFWLGLTARDCSGAYRCYRSSLLQQVDFSRLRALGYAFQEEVLFRCQECGARIVEVPIVFVDRQVGQSKINGREIVRALWDIAAVGIARRQQRSPSRPTTMSAIPGLLQSRECSGPG
jgi:dolichol-phosphate mannosyltransferase